MTTQASALSTLTWLTLPRDQRPDLRGAWAGQVISIAYASLGSCVLRRTIHRGLSSLGPVTRYDLLTWPEDIEPVYEPQNGEVNAIWARTLTGAEAERMAAQ